MRKTRILTGGDKKRAPPTFATLQKLVARTFVSTATWLPRTFSYWTLLEQDKISVVSRRSEYIAYPELELARMLQSQVPGDDLVLVSSYSTSMVSTGITITQNDWHTNSSFVVTCFEPDTLDGRYCYNRWTGLECQVIWGKRISYRKTAPFSKYKTSIDESFVERGADLFIEFLNMQRYD